MVILVAVLLTVNTGAADGTGGEEREGKRRMYTYLYMYVCDMLGQAVVLEQHTHKHTLTILACSFHDHGSLSLSSTGLC